MATRFKFAAGGRLMLVALCYGWIPTSLRADNHSWANLFGANLFRANKSRVSTDELRDVEIVAIYFSAQWCPPCRAFTPRLVETVNQLKKEEKPFEVVLVSSDRSRDDMFKYMREYRMPWLAMPHGSHEGRALSQRFGVGGIPALVVINRDGTPLSANARSEVASKGAQAYADWVAANAATGKASTPAATDGAAPRGEPRAEEPEIRAWTALTGQTIEAALVRELGAYVELKNADGETARVLQTQLSLADREYIRQQRKP